MVMVKSTKHHCWTLHWSADISSTYARVNTKVQPLTLQPIQPSGNDSPVFASEVERDDGNKSPSSGSEIGSVDFDKIAANHVRS